MNRVDANSAVYDIRELQFQKFMMFSKKAKVEFFKEEIHVLIA
jgi:hypothetical protein